MAYLSDNSISLIFVTETWLTNINNDITATIKARGYNILHQVRSFSDKCRGGGVALIYNPELLNMTQVFIKHGTSFEAVLAKFRDSEGENVVCCCVYRPGALTDVFFTEFDEFVGSVFLKFRKIIICGDFNIHLDNHKTRGCFKFAELLSSYGLTQHVKDPTHKLGHLLDVVISSHKVVTPDSIEVRELESFVFPNCDHLPIKFRLLNSSSETLSEKKIITFRNLKGIDHTTLSEDLQSELSTITSESAIFENLINNYNSKCSTVLDLHAPLLTKEIKDRRTAPWFDGEYKVLRTERRKAENKWKNTKCQNDRKHFELLRDQCTELANQKKHNFFRAQFEKHSFSPKSLFSFVDTFLDQEKSLTLPPSESIKDTVDNFNTYFQDKIKAIHDSFNRTSFSNDTPQYNGEKLTEFKPTSIEELDEILKSAEVKSSSMDPLPAELFVNNKEVLLPALCDIVNASLSSGSIEGAKLAHITPLIKGQGLDNSELKNYRPISNLSFVGKLIERVVLKRLNEHLESNNLNVPEQSGYKKMYSTETLLVRVVNDLLIASSETKATIVMLLDLSAAFDTVDHGKLLGILKHELGIEGIAWKWFKSFLTGRSQRIKIGKDESYEIIIRFGVPQGSVLGPVLFNIYIRSLYATVKTQKFDIQGYADDHQLYKSFKSTDEYTMLVEEVPRCFQQVNRWMEEHHLQLNPGKTELLVFGTPAILKELSIRGVFLNSKTCIRLAPVAKNLGFRLDSCLSFKEQIKTVKQSCFLKLRDIGRMKSFLTTKQMSILVQAVIISSIDYCNALYYGCNKSDIMQLQCIQNRACRLIFGLRKRESVDDSMKSLHWLKVSERIEFKLCLLVYKALNGLAPSYISDLITFSNINSRRASSLHIPLTPSSNSRAFQTVAPKLWNQLPPCIKNCDNVDSFKRLLKTHLLIKVTISIREMLLVDFPIPLFS